ncbi:MAG: hypothetical protein HPM95_17785 [Alphaproteobacteria bacterium]|nr:hypothetical protein [Alphaproteobacteria bacterium]
MHPALADAGFHGLFALLSTHENRTGGGFASAYRDGGALRPIGAPCFGGDHHRARQPRSILASFLYLDADGAPVARLSGVRLRPCTSISIRLVRCPPIASRHGFWPAPTPRLALPAKPLRRARAAGLVAEADAGFSPSDDRLLLDALARSVVHASLFEVLGRDPVSPASAVETGRIHDAARPFVAHFLQELALHDLTQEADGQWQVTPPDPALSATTLLNMLFEMSNPHGVEAALLARLARDLPALLRAGLPDASTFATPALLEAYRHESPANAALESAIARACRRRSRVACPTTARSPCSSSDRAGRGWRQRSANDWTRIPRS